jgi:outer membrane protein assembly factor BamB
MILGPMLALAVAAAPAEGHRLPGAPLEIYRIAWKRDLTAPKLDDWMPTEPGGSAWDPVSRLVVVGTRDGWLHAFHADGHLAWEFHGGAAFAAEPLIDGDWLYAGCNDGHLYALAVTTGAVRWDYDAKEQLGTHPALVDGKVVVASLQDTVFAVDAATGAWKWHFRRDTREGFTIQGQASVAVDNGLVYAGFSDGSIVALVPSSGQVRWSRSVSPAGPYLDVDSLAVAGGKIYVASYAGAVAAGDALTGRTLWVHPEAAPYQVMYDRGTLYVVTPTDVQALDAADGTLRWKVPHHGSPGGPPRMAGKWLMVPACKGGLRFIEPRTGRLVRVLDPGKGVNATPLVVGQRVYVLSSGSSLLAIDLE